MEVDDYHLGTFVLNRQNNNQLALAIPALFLLQASRYLVSKLDYMPMEYPVDFLQNEKFPIKKLFLTKIFQEKLKL